MAAQESTSNRCSNTFLFSLHSIWVGCARWREPPREEAAVELGLMQTYRQQAAGLRSPASLLMYWILVLQTLPFLVFHQAWAGCFQIEKSVLPQELWQERWLSFTTRLGQTPKPIYPTAKNQLFNQIQETCPRMLQTLKAPVIRPEDATSFPSHYPPL